MTAKELIKKDKAFPALTGDIQKDTETIIGELAVGNFVVERGMARLYLIWLTREFLNVPIEQYVCPNCGLSFDADGDAEYTPCIRCNTLAKLQQEPMFPTLESYIAHISEMTGKSRQTLFNRLRTYRVLCEERGADPKLVFELNLLSPGAASRLSGADEDDKYISLVNDSWNDTVVAALEQDSKSGALQFIKYDVLHKPKINAEIDGDDIKIHREYFHVNDTEEYVLETYGLKITDDLPEQVLTWLAKKLGARVN